MSPEIRLTPPRRAKRRIAGLVIPWMLSRSTFLCLLAPPFPRPLPPFPRPVMIGFVCILWRSKWIWRQRRSTFLKYHEDRVLPTATILSEMVASSGTILRRIFPVTTLPNLRILILQNNHIFLQNVDESHWYVRIGSNIVIQKFWWPNSGYKCQKMRYSEIE